MVVRIYICIHTCICIHIFTDTDSPPYVNYGIAVADTTQLASLCKWEKCPLMEARSYIRGAREILQNFYIQCIYIYTYI